MARHATTALSTALAACLLTLVLALAVLPAARAEDPGFTDLRGVAGSELPGAEVPLRPEGASSSPERLESVAEGQRILSMDEAREVLVKAGLNAAGHGHSPDASFGACHARAWCYELAAEEAGFAPERAYVVAGVDAIPPANWRAVWPYHTAMVLPVRGHDGVARRMVFDPALDATRPLTFEEWALVQVPGRRSYADGDAMVEPFRHRSSVVTVAPASTTDERYFYPPYVRASVAEGQGGSRHSESVASWEYQQRTPYRDCGPGVPHPQRYVWNGNPLRAGPPEVRTCPGDSASR